MFSKRQQICATKKQLRLVYCCSLGTHCTRTWSRIANCNSLSCGTRERRQPSRLMVYICPSRGEYGRISTSILKTFSFEISMENLNSECLGLEFVTLSLLPIIEYFADHLRMMEICMKSWEVWTPSSNECPFVILYCDWKFLVSMRHRILSRGRVATTIFHLTTRLGRHRLMWTESKVMSNNGFVGRTYCEVSNGALVYFSED